LIAVCALMLSAAPLRGEQMSADLIVWNAEIWTGEKGAGKAEAIAVKGDRIVFVGSNQRALDLKGPDTRLIDAGKRFLMPGFIDNHTHFVDGGFSLLGVNLRPARDEAEFARLLGDYARSLPKGTWITGGSWDHETWPSKRIPARQLIDSQTPDHPVFVDRLDGHMALANGLALKTAGIDRNTKDVPGGEIVRDANGEPTGLLKDAAMTLVTKVIPAPSEADRLRAAEAAMQEARQLGVTSVNAMCGAEDVRILQQLHLEGKLTVRVYAATPIERWAALRDAGVTKRFGGDYLVIGAVKGFMDGSLGSTTAWFFEPYSDAPNTSGLPASMFFPEGNMKKLIKSADQAGLHVVVHAIGDRANAELLKIYEEVQRENGEKDRRFRIEHAQHLAAASIPRFARLGVIASMQPYHLPDDGRWAEKRIGAARLRGTYAFADLLRQGAVLTFGSDWPVAPLNPLLGVWAAVTRQTLDGKNPDGWIPDQKITVEQALECYTSSNAFAVFAEDRLGSLRAGKLADFVILSANPLKSTPAHLRDIRVTMTAVGGKIVHEATATKTPPTE